MNIYAIMIEMLLLGVLLGTFVTWIIFTVMKGKEGE